jgi:ankyrin repeat protein
VEKDKAKEILESRFIPVKDEMLFKFISDKEVVEALLVMGANPNYYDTYFNCPILSLAYSRDEYSVFKLLLEHGANPNVTSSTDMDKRNIIFEAIWSRANGINRYLKTLIKYKVDLNVKEPKSGEPLIMWSLSTGYYIAEIIELLLKSGADINLKSDAGLNIFDLVAKNQVKLDQQVIMLINSYKK